MSNFPEEMNKVFELNRIKIAVRSVQFYGFNGKSLYFIFFFSEGLCFKSYRLSVRMFINSEKHLGIRFDSVVLMICR